MLCLLNDEPSMDDLQILRPMPICKKIMMYLLAPLVTLAESLRLLFSRHDKNPFKTGKALRGQKRGVCKFDVGCTLPEMKQFCRERGLTFNDMVMAVVSNSIHEYFQKYEHEGPPGQLLDRVQCGFAFSIRETPKSLK